MPISGTTGLLIGSVSSLLLSSKTPTLFALASSLQWFLLGSTFWGLRSTLLYTWSPLPDARPTVSERLYGVYPTPKDRMHASTLAGGITGGAIGGLVRGRRNVIPGTIIWMVFGYAGQRIYNTLDEKHSEEITGAAEEEAKASNQERGFWDRIAEMKWSPMKKLSDEDYADTLREKVLGLEAQITLVDEEMERVRKEDQVQGRSIHEIKGNEKLRS